MRRKLVPPKNASRAIAEGDCERCGHGTIEKSGSVPQISRNLGAPKNASTPSAIGENTAQFGAMYVFKYRKHTKT